jgi:hypothetical protein
MEEEGTEGRGLRHDVISFELNSSAIAGAQCCSFSHCEGSTSRLELCASIVKELMNLFRLNKLPSPRVVPLWLGGQRVCQIIDGILLLGLGVLALQAREKPRHNEAVMTTAEER